MCRILSSPSLNISKDPDSSTTRGPDPHVDAIGSPFASSSPAKQASSLSLHALVSPPSPGPPQAHSCLFIILTRKPPDWPERFGWGIMNEVFPFLYLLATSLLTQVRTGLCCHKGTALVLSTLLPQTFRSLFTRVRS